MTDQEEIERQLREGKIVSVTPLNRSIAFLMTIGFQPAGYWRQAASGGPEPVLTSGMGKEHDLLYAFATDGERFGEEHVHYIGKTTNSLSQRMRGYQLPGPTQRTNKAIHAKIVELLAAGGQAYPKTVFMRSTQGKDVESAAGLEGLIQDLDPPWNRPGRRR